MDASIMDGKKRLAGAVASVSIVKNPIKLARKVAEETDHVLLVGDGAEAFAKNAGIEIVDSSYFYHEERLQRVRNLKKNVSKFHKKSDKIGTVGAVALDKMGNISAATSTGGMTNKMPGELEILQLLDRERGHKMVFVVFHLLVTGNILLSIRLLEKYALAWST